MKSPEWLHSEFTLGYFVNKASTSQEEYRKFVQSLVGQKYDCPLKEVVGSVLFGNQGFINFIKQNFISSRKPNKDLPALGQLVPRIAMEVIFAEVDLVFVQGTVWRCSITSSVAGDHSCRMPRTDIIGLL